MSEIIIIFIFLAVILFLQLISLIHYRGRVKDREKQIESFKQEIEASNKIIKDLQNEMKQIGEKEKSLSDMLIFFPDYVSKLTSYNERRNIYEIAIEWINHALKPERSYIFAERDGQWVSVVRRGGPEDTGEARCGKEEGILGVASDLKITIDADALTLLGVEKRRKIDKDPLEYLGMQVCSPMVYGDEVYGIIALGGIENYSVQIKSLISMISDLAASSLVNAMLFSRFKYQASRDPLTNLVNKRGFEQAMTTVLVKSSREKRSFSVFMFDIDHFKTFNDTNGHQEGDEALRITAKLIEDSFRSGDIKARYGGEEFIVLMEDASKEQAHRLAERFRDKVEQHPYPLEQSQPGGKLTISGGIAAFPVDGDNAKEIIEKADEALYKAKSAGRNRVFKATASYLTDEYVPERRVKVTKIGEKEKGRYPVGTVFSGNEKEPLLQGKTYYIQQDGGMPIRFSKTIKVDGNTFETEKSIYQIDFVEEA